MNKYQEALNNKELKWIRDYLYQIQFEYEQEKEYNEQSIRVNNRIRTLLDIYEQMLNGRTFDEEYLRRYVR